MKQRIEAAEVAASINIEAADGCLPFILPEDDLNGAAACALRAQGYKVMTMEQCMEMMV